MSASAPPGREPGARHRRRAEAVVRVLVAAGLGVEAVIHLRLAEAMQIAAPGGIGGGTLFRLQGAAAVLAAVLLLLTGSRLGYAVAALVALSALGPVLLYSVLDVPAFGPVPAMYDPTWPAAKVVSVVAEGAAVVLSLVGLRLVTRRAPAPVTGTGRRGPAATTPPTPPPPGPFGR